MEKIKAFLKKHPEASSCLLVILFMALTFEFIMKTLAIDYLSNGFIALLAFYWLLQFLLFKIIKRLH